MLKMQHHSLSESVVVMIVLMRKILSSAISKAGVKLKSANKSPKFRIFPYPGFFPIGNRGFPTAKDFYFKSVF